MRSMGENEHENYKGVLLTLKRRCPLLLNPTANSPNVLSGTSYEDSLKYIVFGIFPFKRLRLVCSAKSIEYDDSLIHASMQSQTHCISA